MKQFSLEEYIKNPSRKIVTRDGRNARILCTDVKRALYPVIALVDDGCYESPVSYTKNGECFLGQENYCDLFFTPKKHEKVTMNENLDLTKILKGCPIGTEFYHTGYGKVWFIDIYPDCPYPIIFRLGYTICNGAVTSAGTINKNYDGECVFFPSEEQRDWSKFVRFWDKPKVEKFDPKTLKPFDKVLVRDDDCYWTADLFSHIDDSIGKVCCSVFLWKQCVPYNDETKHLVGTTDDCPEFYKWWEE